MSGGGYSPYRVRSSSGNPFRGGDSRWTNRYSEIHTYVAPAVTGAFEAFPPQVTTAVSNLLTVGEKRKPYSHQAATARAVLVDDHNVVLVTPVASGKTTAFLSVVLTQLQLDPNATAMLLYPMNALAEDQLKNLIELGFAPEIEVGLDGEPRESGLFKLSLDGIEIIVGVLNGDTTDDTRRNIRKRARIILTNQVMLHAGLLAQSWRSYADGTSWERFFTNLSVFVLDEAHSQNGVPGTETALLLRRLWAQIEFKGGRLPNVIVCTATIGNPVEHAKSLTGLQDWTLIDKSGARSFPRTFKVIAPGEHPRGGKWAASVVAQELALAEMAAGKRVLIFVQSRPATERMAIRINEKAGKDSCVAFNAAIPREQKKVLLNMILTGKTKAVVSTSALELGVDIGGLDSAVLVGHPGDQASLFQRAGRVGRTSPGTVFLVLDENQHSLNSYLESVPTAILDHPESRTIYPDNPRLAIRHAACCLLETSSIDPLSSDLVGDATSDPLIKLMLTSGSIGQFIENKPWDPNDAPLVDGLLDALANWPLIEKWFPLAVNERKAIVGAVRGKPHASVSMLGTGSMQQFILLNPDEVGRLQVLAGDDALLCWHPGALVRGFDGELFRVKSLDHKKGKGFTEAVEEEALKGYGTMPIVDTQHTPGELTNPTLDTPARIGVLSVAEGSFRISSQTVAYKLIAVSGRTIGEPVVHTLRPGERNPIREFDTRGAIVSIDGRNPLGVLAMRSDASKWLGAMTDVLKQAIPLIVQARPADVVVKIQPDSMRGGLQIVVLDYAEGGMGWTAKLIRNLDAWFKAAGRLLAHCRCKGSGCPRCAVAGPDRIGRLVLANILTGEKPSGASVMKSAGPILLVKKGVA